MSLLDHQSALIPRAQMNSIFLYALEGAITIYLGLNFVIRLGFLPNFYGKTVILSVFLVFFGWISRHCKGFITRALFILAMGMAWAGFQPYRIQTIYFEFALTAVSIWLYLEMQGGVLRGFQHQLPGFEKEPLFKLFFIFVSLSLLSLLMLPIREIGQTLWLWGPVAFTENSLRATPDSIFYPLAALNRLLLFLLFVGLLAIGVHAAERYRVVLLGLIAGTVIASLVGILDFHGALSLISLRDLDPIENPKNIMLRLQSTFGHPGWFAEYATTTIPLLLIGFGRSKRKTPLLITAWIVAIVICEYAILQSKARGGWIANLLTLMSGVAVWFWLKCDYKSAIDKFLQKQYRKFCYVAIGIAATVLILGVRLIYTVEDDRRHIAPGKKPISKIDRATLKNRILLMFNPNERLHLWKHGIAAGLEAPLFGIGYETYAWHQKILKQQSGSYFHKWKLAGPNLDTPHSFYIQHFTNNGIVGIVLWLSMLFFILKQHCFAQKILEDETTLATLLGIINFHVYGLFQSMNYVPVVWLLIFILYGNAVVTTYRRKTIALRGCIQKL